MSVGRPKKHTVPVKRVNFAIPQDLFLDISKFKGYLQSKTGAKVSTGDILVNTLFASPEYADFKRWRKNLEDKKSASSTPEVPVP